MYNGPSVFSTCGMKPGGSCGTKITSKIGVEAVSGGKVPGSGEAAEATVASAASEQIVAEAKWRVIAFIVELEHERARGHGARAGRPLRPRLIGSAPNLIAAAPPA